MLDAVVCATGRIDGIETSVAAMEYSFIGGSMGVVVGEKITRAIERAIPARQPVVIVSCSGGARMMEGILSLMQMAKVSAALARLSQARLPYISVLTDPTTGGVTASYAMLGDVNVAEPKALIGFAGPRVIEQTIRQTLPEGFQRSEFLLAHGMLDLVVDRREMKATSAACCTCSWTTRRRRGPCPRPPRRHRSSDPLNRRVAAFDRLLDPDRASWKLDLSRIRALVAALDHPERACPTVLIAGTNGKGSVAAMVERALRAAGLRTGRYTSPHLVRPEERVAIDGAPVDGADFDRAIEDVLAVEAACLADGRLAEHGDVLRGDDGRRLRAAAAGAGRRRRHRGRPRRPAATPPTSVIPWPPPSSRSISITRRGSGDTRAAIAAEKAAIAAAGVPLVVGDLTDEALDVVVATAEAAGAPLVYAAEGVECVRQRRRRRPPDDHARHGDADLRPGAARASPATHQVGQRVRRGGAARGARRRRHPRRSPRRRDRPRRRALAGAARSRRARRRAARAARRRAQRRRRAGAGRLARPHDAGRAAAARVRRRRATRTSPA